MCQTSTWSKKQKPIAGRWGVYYWVTRDKVYNYQYMVLNTVSDSNSYSYMHYHPKACNKANAQNK